MRARGVAQDENAIPTPTIFLDIRAYRKGAPRTAPDAHRTAPDAHFVRPQRHRTRTEMCRSDAQTVARTDALGNRPSSVSDAARQQVATLDSLGG
jgi:hypothetical protein